MTTWTIRHVADSDEPQWRALYRGYRAFYEKPDSETAVDTTWEWVSSGAHGMTSLVAVDEDGSVGGFANIRPFARPLAASIGLYLDDLFTRPDLRGQGIAGLLLERLRAYASEQGLSIVAWDTHPTNLTARRLYDTVAVETPWITYEMEPGVGDA